MSKEVLKFTVQPDKLLALRDSLTSQGITVEDMTCGSADAGHSIQISWSYAAPTLSVTIDVSGFFSGTKMDKAKEKLNDAIGPFTG
jgi:hypothetical protein